MERQDWALIVTARAGNEGLPQAKIQKTLYLLGRRFPEAVGEGYYKFVSYNYGPFDVAAYGDIERMAMDRLIHVRQAKSGGWFEYAATFEGLNRAERLQPLAPPQVLRYLDRVLSWIKLLSFDELVREVGRRYPMSEAAGA